MLLFFGGGGLGGVAFRALAVAFSFRVLTGKLDHSEHIFSLGLTSEGVYSQVPFKVFAPHF